METPFRKDFIWGAATASYQIEGAWNQDGKGPSVWDEMSHQGGKVFQNHTGDVACDHYNRWEEDIGLMEEVGLKGYRFSISWSRVIPEGTGKVNPKGLAFYDKLVDGLLAAGIQPWVTLFHWDYPLALYRRGGWLNRDSVEWFADYTRVIVDKLSDRVDHWMTLNEPQIFCVLGHLNGSHAPGDKLSRSHFLRVSHHALLAHGRSVQVIRARAKLKPKIGYAPAGNASCPATESKADIAAARKAHFAVDGTDPLTVGWWTDPVFLGKYPADGLKAYEKDLPEIRTGDMKLMCQKLDFIGYNAYSGNRFRAGPKGVPVSVDREPGYATGTLWWLVLEPDTLYWLARFYSERYGNLPVVVTENGFCNLDWVAADGQVHDLQRIDQGHRYLQGLARAAREGIEVLGYFHWSFMDNFEWAEGYKDRFGMIHVDFKTLKRTPKDSSRWYSHIIETNGSILSEAPDFSAYVR